MHAFNSSTQAFNTTFFSLCVIFSQVFALERGIFEQVFWWGIFLIWEFPFKA